MHGSSVLIGETPEALSSFYRVRTQQEDAIYEPEIGPSPDPKSAAALALDFQSPDL